MKDAAKWRLVISEPADGPWNMAVDEAMLQAGVEGLIPPTLRFYAWQPPAVSLGFFQPLDEGISRSEIARRGFGLVRRPSGGRAILHNDELTYSVVVPEGAIKEGRSVMGSYRTLSRGIEAGLGLLGVGAEFAERKSPERMRAQGLPTVCFAKAAKCDMTVAGRKIVGSAQTRRRGVIMQHGSVPITMDPQEHLAVMPGGGEGAENHERLRQSACGVAEALGRVVSFEELAQALAEGFRQNLGIELTPGELTDWELAQAHDLREHKYATEAWTATPGKRDA
jgi:lipoate-protein ligase A